MLRTSLLCLLLGSLATSIQAQCTTQNVRESVVNGDFEQGYVAGQFTTDEIYLYDPSNSAMSTIVNSIKASGVAPSCAWTSATHFEIDKYYGPFTCSGINYDGHPFISEGNGRYDHTYGVGGTGKYLMIDGQLGAPSGLGWKLWEQTIPVYANEMYYFTAWFINLTPLSTGGDRVDIRFVVTPLDGGGTPLTAPVQLGAAFSPAEASRGNNWEQAFQTYTPPIGTVSVRLGIYNQAGATNGNDVAIDDISFQNGCSNILSLSIPPAPTLPAALNICESNGTMTLNSNVPTNVGAGRTFSWFTGVGATQTAVVSNSTSQTTYNITTPGTYRVCVYQAGGCAKSSTVVVSATASATGSDINICQTSALAATITSSAVAPFLTYSWTKNGSAWGGSVNNVNATADGAGTFLLTGTHSNGIAACNVSKSFNVTASTATLTSNIGPGPYNLCTTPAQVLTSSLTGTGYTYQWYKGGVAIGGATSSTYTATSTGSYTVEVSFPTAGCTDVTSNSVTVNSTNAITPVNATFCPNAAVGLSVTPTLASVYRWYDSDNTTIVQAVGAGSSAFTTPTLSASHTYYVEDARSTSTTLTTTAGSNNSWATYGILNFDLSNPITLKTITVTRAGQWQGPLNGALEIVNSSGTVIATSNVSAVADGSTTLTFAYTFGGGAGFTIPTGTGYKIRFSSTGLSLGALQSQSLPAGSGMSNVSATTYNNVFGNWTVDVPSNTCSRVPVIATAFCALPVNLVSFNGFQSNGRNQLTWTTLNEINSSSFVVQRSTDGVNFTDIASQPAAGFSSVLINYAYDEAALNGTVYYRLKQVDIDGAYNYTGVVSINGVASALGTLLTNPATTVVQVQLTGAHEATVNVAILNIHGVVIYQGSYAGDELVTINTALTPGIYIVKLEGSSSAESHKLVAE